MRIDTVWWKEDPELMHQGIVPAIRALNERQTGYRDMVMDHLGLYMDRDVGDFASAIKARSTSLFARSQRRVNLNVVKSCIDTVMAKIVAHRPKPMFVTTAGRFADRQKARKLERWVDGLFYREKLYAEQSPQVFLDAGIFGTGALKIFEENGEVRLEWAWIGELIFDEVASLFSPPRVLFQTKQISRETLLNLYPKFKYEINSLDDASSSSDMSQDYIVDDMVEVIEAWHLPSSRGADDGRHAIVIDGATLESEEWKDDDFPFVFFRWSRNPLGFLGIGLSEELKGIQVEIKHLLSRVQEAMQLLATVWILKPRGSKLSDEHISNKIGTILEYDGPVPPKVETPASMNSQVFEHIRWLYDKAYEIAGISQLSASGTKPAGIESGIALRTLIDVETQRFAMLARDWEEFYLEVARRAVKCAKKTYRSGGGKIRWADRSLVDEIEWKDVNLEEDAYVLRIYPVNLLPSTPAGKLATIQEMMNMQMITPEEAKSLLDFPDLEKIQDLTNASYEDVLQIMDNVLYKGEYTAPTPEMFLEAGIRLANHYWCKGRMEGAPEDRLDLLVRWMEDAKAILAPPAPPMPPGAEMMPPPGAEGMMPPEGMPEMPPGASMPPAPAASPAEAAAGLMAPPPPEAGL